YIAKITDLAKKRVGGSSVADPAIKDYTKLLHLIESTKWCRMTHVKKFLYRHQRGVRNSKEQQIDVLYYSSQSIPL
uniref:Uncharacterized protein n=1 Tax=Romanomermis culicivorax TaxID=13658 RepID=A0A915JPR4_ROMCU